MPTLHLVRHGQASFGAADYDQLSPLGQQQCQALGAHWHAQGLRFDAVVIGAQRRHRQSAEAILAGLGQNLPLHVDARLNEYDFEAVIAAAVTRAERPPDPDDRRAHFRLLREGLLGWMGGQLEPQGLPAHAQFLAEVMAALDAASARAQDTDARVLVVSSGGPISNAVGQVLQASAQGMVQLNLRLRNSGVCELVGRAGRLEVLSFNALPHLEQPERQSWQTYA